MKKELKFAYLSLIINLYYFIVWIYVFESFGYQEGSKKFTFLFPALLLSSIGTHIFLLLFTIFSIIIFSRSKTPHIFMVVFQVIAGLLYIWGHL